MYLDIEFWCKLCVDCVIKKLLKNRLKFLLNLLLIVNGLFDRVVVDVFGLFLLIYKLNKYIIVFSDYLIWWFEVFVVNNVDVEIIV